MNRNSLPQEYATEIARAYPHLTIERVEQVKGGQFNDVLLVNDKLLFRFSKVAPALATLEREVAILQHIAGQLPLPVPHPLYVNLHGQQIGAAFMGYRLLPGQPLWRRDIAGLMDETILNRMARQLAGFLQALHVLPTAELRAASIPLEDSRTMWASFYRRVREKLFPHMRPDAQRQVSAHFTAFLEDPIVASFDPALRHGDFGGGNILWAPDEGIVTGVVDFGAAALGDAATDLASLAAGFGEPFLQRASHTYRITATMRARIAFYRGTFALQEALFGLENDDAEAFAAGMAAYI